ncbi:GAF domain-containing sensor histidine kinase [Loktanella sp. DJP18]|uniref:GAF domain-containing sensor histidine kinase n=1 Tax=Loktanella sp. DJP18 TaxID=3409788 RepID=UPI003BB4A428
MVDADTDFQRDIAAIASNAQVPVILETIQLATGMGFAAVARVTDSRWITCRAVDTIAFGLLPGDELDIETTLCHEVHRSNAEIVIDDVAADKVWSDHRSPVQYGYRSYISVPIHRRDGSFFGTLCAIDPTPRTVSDDRIVSMFRLFAQIIGEGLEMSEQLEVSEAAVGHERHLADMQDRFIAILAHDLRNPVSVLSSGFRMMERREMSDDLSRIVTLMKGSVKRMALLIENLLDSARKRTGEGLIINATANGGLVPVLQQIVEELAAVSPDQRIEASIDLPDVLVCDSDRVAQLLSNLLANAVTYGTPDTVITLDAHIEGKALVCTVSNQGARIGDAQRARLFLPFEQGTGRASREGLGLGLYIAAEIAKGHGGTLDVDSNEARTVFTLRLPDVLPT